MKLLELFENPYDVLNLSINSSKEEVKSRYHELAKKFHPDINPTGEEKFKQITQAYNDIMNKSYNDLPKLNMKKVDHQIYLSPVQALIPHKEHFIYSGKKITINLPAMSKDQTFSISLKNSKSILVGVYIEDLEP